MHVFMVVCRKLYASEKLLGPWKIVYGNEIMGGGMLGGGMYGFMCMGL